MAWNNLPPRETWELNSLVLWNNFWIRDFIAFYIKDENKIWEILSTLEGKWISWDMPQKDIEKSMKEFERILRKINAWEALKPNELLEKNVFYTIYTEIQKVLFSQTQDQFKDFIRSSGLSDLDKKRIISLNEQISKLEQAKKTEFETAFQEFLIGKKAVSEMADNPIYELSILLEKSMKSWVTNLNLDAGFQMAFSHSAKRSEVEQNVWKILGTIDIATLKNTQDYKDFMGFLELYQSGKMTPEKEKEFLFSGNTLYIAFQYIISEFIKETLKTLKESTYLGIPPALDNAITWEKMELTKLFLLKYPTDGLLMLLAFNGVFFWSQLVLSAFWLSPANLMSVIPSEIIAALLSILSVKLRTNAKNNLMRGNGAIMSILKGGKWLPQMALLLVLAAHGLWIMSVFSRTWAVNDTFVTIDKNFTAFNDTLIRVIWEPGKEADSELGKLAKQFWDKCMEVVTAERTTWGQGRWTWFFANSYAKYYLCFWSSTKKLSEFGATVPVLKTATWSTAPYDNAVTFRKQISGWVALEWFPQLGLDEHIEDFINRRILFFRAQNKVILEKIHANKKLVSDYRIAVSQWFLWNLIDYYIYQTSYNIESIEWHLTGLSTDAETLKTSYELLKKQLTLIRETLVEWLNAIDKTWVANPTSNVIDIVIPNLNIDTTVIETIAPAIADSLKVSDAIKTQPTELFWILKWFYGFPAALSILIWSILVALTAETGPIFVSRGMMHRRGETESQTLEAFLPNLIKSIRTIVKKVKQELDTSQITTFLGTWDISEDQIMEWLVTFLKENAKRAMRTEWIVRAFARWTKELIDPFDHSLNGEKYNELIFALKKLQSPKWLLEFLSDVLPGLGQILDVYENQVKIWDLIKTPPNLSAIRKLPDTRSISIINNHKQKILTNRRRKVGIEFLIGAIQKGSLTIESLTEFVSREDGEKLKHSDPSKIIWVLERMKAEYAEKAIKAVDDFKAVAKISDLDLWNIDAQIEAMPDEIALTKNFETQIWDLQWAISERKKRWTHEIHNFEITSHINVDINIVRFIIWDLIDELN